MPGSPPWGRRNGYHCGVRTLLTLVCCADLLGCKPAQAEPIPEALRGAFGRTAQDMLHGTNGLEIGADMLTLSEMTIAIKEGKVVGDDYQVDLAEVRWKKDGDKIPAKCKGTIARDDERLFLRLFALHGDEPCESILEGDWNAWSQVTTFPKPLQGWFGSAWAYSRSSGVRVLDNTAVSTSGGMLELTKGLVWDGHADEIVVTESNFGDAICRGAITVDNDRIRSVLTPVDEGTDCPDFVHGERWRVENNRLPQAPLSNGKLTIAMLGDEVRIEAKEGAKVNCTQRVVRTKSRGSMDRAHDNIPVLSGAVLALEQAEIEGDVQACRDALKRLDAVVCEQYRGGPCNEAMLAEIAEGAEAAQMLCPSHIVIGDPEPNGRRVALLPTDDPTNHVCFQTTARFQ